MTNFFDKEDSGMIRDMNELMGTKHRTVPFDFANADELNEALTYAVCAFSDYRRYQSMLFNVEEQFDESIEHFDTATWLNSTLNYEKADRLTMKTVNALKKASDYMTALCNKAENHCKKILHIALCSPEAHQNRIFGMTVNMNDEEADKFIEDLFDKHLCDFEFSYAVPENYSNFIAFTTSKLNGRVTQA